MEAEKVHKIIGSNVRKYRKKKKLSQMELSHKIGYHSTSVISLGEICHNGYHFNIIQLAKIAKVLDVSICEFFKGVDEIIMS